MRFFIQLLSDDDLHPLLCGVALINQLANKNEMNLFQPAGIGSTEPYMR